MADILVTGSAGFIGSHVAHRLLDRGDRVVGVDNITPYYDPALKQARLARLTAREGYRHLHLDLADREGAARLFDEVRPAGVVHLAAQPGVRTCSIARLLEGEEHRGACGTKIRWSRRGRQGSMALKAASWVGSSGSGL